MFRRQRWELGGGREQSRGSVKGGYDASRPGFGAYATESSTAATGCLSSGDFDRVFGVGNRGSDDDARADADADAEDEDALARRGRKEPKETLEGWAFTGRHQNTYSKKGQPVHEGACDNCGRRCEVPFRPVIGGKPPTCSTCRKNDVEKRAGTWAA